MRLRLFNGVKVRIINGRPCLAVCGFQSDSARQISPKHPDQKELPIRMDVGFFNEILAKMYFWKEVREERHQLDLVAAMICDQIAMNIPEAQSKRRLIRVVDIIFSKGKDGLLSTEIGQSSDLLTVK